MMRASDSFSNLTCTLQVYHRSHALHHSWGDKLLQGGQKGQVSQRKMCVFLQPTPVLVGAP